VIVAIDGPAGAGKSTVARAVGAALGLPVLDTGAMYRAVAWLAIRRELPLDDGTVLAALATDNPVSFDDEGRVWIADSDVTDAIRKPEIDGLVPLIARQMPLRGVLRERQRELGRQGNAVIEGRDIGTVVAPDAAVKVFLVADESVRASRRAGERPGADERELAAQIRQRDASDAAQTVKADDAVELDTTELTIDEVVERIESLVRKVPA
jgi:cytidylate kinase